MRDSKKSVVFNIVESFLILFAIYNIGGLESTDILTLVIGVVIYLFLSRAALRTDNRRLIRTSSVTSIIFTVAYLILFIDRIRAGLENPMFAAVYIILTTIGLFALFYEVSLIVINFVGSGAHKECDDSNDDGVGSVTSADVGSHVSVHFDIKRFVIYSLIILVCMIPFLLLNYPGVMTVDSMWQWEQAAGISSYSDHHPWMHTLLIKLMYVIGHGLTGSEYVGIACYSVFQMIIMATSVSYAIVTVTERMTAKKAAGIGLALLLLYVLYPYNLIYAVTMWKDIIFSAGVLIYSVTLYRIVRDNVALSVRDIILYALSSFVFCMFRHNGFYAWIVCSVIFIIIVFVIMKKRGDSSFRRLGSGLVISLIAMAALCALIDGPVMKACDVTAGDEVYNYCIPLQQIGRVVQDGAELTDSQRESLEKINTIEYIENNYIPGGADNMFCWLQMGDEDYFKANRGEYVKVWLQLGLKHPIKYLQAYVDQTKGYYTPMNPEQVVYFGVTDNNNGLETKPIINGPVLIKINELLTKLYTMIPVYGILYSMGTCMLLLVMVIAALIYAGKYRKLLPILPIVLLQLTVLIAVPLVADMRYGYPLVLVLPYLVITSCDE